MCSSRSFQRISWLYVWFSVFSGLGCLPTARAQTDQISGRVIDAATQTAVPFVNVYLDGSSVGTTTDEQGRFQLRLGRLGSVELIASSVGYLPGRQTLQLANDQPNTVNFSLTPTAQLLETVTVKGKKDVTWLRQFQLFERELLGVSSSDCRIENREVVDFTEVNGNLRATARSPLLIRNSNTGYTIRYDLQHFHTGNGATFYGGTGQFTELTPDNPRQARTWQKNRLRVYLGSLRHLLASLVSNTAEEQGFLVYIANPDRPITSTPPQLRQEVNKHMTPFLALKAIRAGATPGEYWLNTTGTLEVFYTKGNITTSPYIDAPYPYAQLQLPQGIMGITADGLITASKGYVAKGYLQADRLGRALPADWQPEATKVTGDGAEMAKQGRILPANQTLTTLSTTWQAKQTPLAPTVFVHIDKPLYTTGDWLWLSAYVADANTHRLYTANNKPGLHIELRSPTGTLVQHHWLRVEAGRAAGQFRLTDTLPTGVYQVRAYTELDKQYARPAFERTILLRNVRSDQFAPATQAIQTDSVWAQFLPEGGHWVTGLPARWGVKAVGSNGRGVLVRGQILTAGGRVLATVSTNQRGMGHADIPALPASDLPLRAELTSPVGPVGYGLPVAEQTGLTLAVGLAADSNQVRMTVRGRADQARATTYLLVQGRGKLVYQAHIQLLDGQGQVNVPTVLLPPGLCQVSLLDSLGTLRAERLLFRPLLGGLPRLQVSTDSLTYQPRQPVKLSFTLTDEAGKPAQGYLSASITDAAAMPADTLAANILTHLLLTGDLRGEVEAPNEYFDTRLPDRATALDDLLLTQGWRRIGWGAPIQPASPADTLSGLGVRGQVNDPRGGALSNVSGVVLSSDQRQPFTHAFTADAAGQFSLFGLHHTDTIQVLTQVKNRQQQPVRAIVQFSHSTLPFTHIEAGPTPDWRRLASFWQVAKARQASDTTITRYRQSSARQLAEVVVRAPTQTDKRPESIRRRSIHNQVSKSVIINQATAASYPNLYVMLANHVPGVTLRFDPVGSAYNLSLQSTLKVPHMASNTPATAGQPAPKETASSPQNPLFLMDGLPLEDIDGRQLLSFAPADIDRVEVLEGALAAMYGSRSARGVVAFYTRVAQDSPAVRGRVGATELVGYTPMRTFYTPRYTYTPTTEDRVPDQRDVLFWKPIMNTDARGNTNLVFPLSDQAKFLQITVQGLTTTGEPIYLNTVRRVRP